MVSCRTWSSESLPSSDVSGRNELFRGELSIYIVHTGEADVYRQSLPAVSDVVKAEHAKFIKEDKV